MEKFSSDFYKDEEEAYEIKEKADKGLARDYQEADLMHKLQKTKDELDDAWNTIEWLNSKHEGLIGEYKDLFVESTTGLKRREFLYKDMDGKIAELLDIEKINNINDEEFLNILKSKSPDDFKNEPLYVMFGDMAYLSLANEGGHRSGDELLSETGKAVKDEFFGASRRGGDEFTTLVLLKKKEAEEKIRKLEEKIRGMKKIPSLEYYNLEPNMDIGIAHFSEGLKVFKEIAKSMEQTKEGKEKLSKLNILKELQNIWLEIADKRSSIKKAMERIPLLVKKRENEPKQYEELYGFLNKGAYSATDSDIEKMAEKIKKGENPEEVIFDYIKNKEHKSLKKLFGYEKVKAEIILKTADNKML
ncbi:diguanylate cyclase [Candidatus Parcubacteria bacterium]|nr:diguanylate cyclase [Candidatus Parcubacteria bacterium]